MTMKKTLLAVALAPLCLQSSFVSAQTTTDETMVVTANRFEQSAKNTIASVSVVTKEEIDAIQAKSLTEVLRRLPGVQVVAGGYGQTTEVFVRGTKSAHLLVLINGVRIGSATLGAVDFSQIPLTGVERIELVRGTRAAQYGSDAIGGVLNIITAYQQGENLAQATAGGGSNGFYELGASLAGEIGSTSWGKVAIKTNGADGFSARKAPYESDNDGFEQSNAVAEIGTRIDDNWAASLQGYFQDGESEYDDGFFASGAEAENSLYNLASHLKYSDERLNSEVILAYNEDESENKTDSSPGSKIATDRTVATWQNHYQLNSNVDFGGGLEWNREKVSHSSSRYTDDKRDNMAVYVTSIYHDERWLFEGSARTDDNDSYGRNNTWQLGAAYHITSQVQLSANAGTAFKAPSFNDLYWPGQGNPELEPEEAQSAEFTLQGQYERFNWGVTWYQNDVDKLIAWAPDASGNWMPSNINQAELKGLEAIVGFDTGPIRHDLSYDFLDSEDKETKKELARRSRHSGKWNMSYLAEQWQFDLSAIYKGTSYEDAFNTQKLGAFTLFDLGASYYLSENLTLRGRIDNLFDADYEVKSSYNVQERSYYANVTYQF